MCWLEQGGGLINEQQGVGPLCLVFDFTASAEMRQLILCQWKEYNKHGPLSWLSSTISNTARDYDPMKQ